MTNEPAEAHVVGDTVNIPISSRRGVFAVVSADKYDLVKGKRFAVNGGGYAQTYANGRYFLLSHLVAGTQPLGMVKDHINNDKLDNRTENLRNATPSQNAQNKRKKRGCSSKYIGVCRHKRRSQIGWQCNIRSAGRVYYAFKETELEAARSYDRAAYFFYGEHARTNNLLSKDEIQLALKTAPQTPVKKSSLPPSVVRRGKKFQVLMTDLHNKKQYHGTFETVTEAAAKAEEIRGKREAERERSRDKKSITYNSEGQAYIVANKTTDHPLEVLVDESLWDEIDGYSWSSDGQKYPSGRIEGNLIFLHIFVWKKLHPNEELDTPTHQIDHRNHNILDVRGENLHKLTCAENTHKRRKMSGTTSRFVGVHRAREKWAAAITVKGRKKWLGYFDVEEDAGAAYQSAARLYYPACYDHEPKGETRL
jgi:hypothetical protein